MASIRGIASFLILMSFMIGFAVPAHAVPVYSLPDYGYNYSYWKQAEPAPYPYLAEKHVYGSELGIGNFNVPQDLFVADDRRIYIADTGNNRIVSLDENGQLIRTIDGFDNGGKKEVFNKPNGVFVSPDHIIYVADTYNNRIVKLTNEGEFIESFGTPTSSIIRKDFQYFPLKVNVDKFDRIYVIAQGAFDGIMELDFEGNFKGYVGVNKVKFSPIDRFWKQFSTKQQSEKMELFLPVEFSNIDVDDRGFIYAISAEANSDTPIKRFNPGGDDILRREGYFNPKGDIGLLTFTDIVTSTRFRGSSRFIDVLSDESGMYSGLDATRNRIFTYDHDGNLLYQFGGIGTQSDNFQKAVGFSMVGEKVAVLDNEMNRLTFFAPTRYGQLIREAVKAHYAGKVEEAETAWRQVLQLNANFDIAYISMGKAALKKDETKLAMEYFEHGNNRKYYSEAFKRYRKEFVWNHFGTIMMILISAVVLFVAGRMYWARRKPKLYFVETGILKAPFYTILRPFNGFYEMKFEQKGRVKIALFIVGALIVTMILKRQFSGFVVNTNRLSTLNSIDELMYIVLPFVLFCVANWSLTTLMDGEGKFKEIIMAVGYSLLPLVILYLPQIIFSNMITKEEAAFYYLIDSIAIAWTLFLLFVGLMTVHQYSIFKTILTLFLTVIVMIFIVFLCILCFSLLQQVISFVISIITEIRARA